MPASKPSIYRLKTCFWSWNESICIQVRKTTKYRRSGPLLQNRSCLVVMRTRDKARAFDCKILYSTPCSVHELNHFGATYLHDLQTGFHSIVFCRMENSLKYQFHHIGILKTRKLVALTHFRKCSFSYLIV